jgi:hypothetical protein
VLGEPSSIHLARYSSGSELQGLPNYDASRKMYDLMPADIRAWLDAKGGLVMPDGNFWTLKADELWKMGYRRCD